MSGGKLPGHTASDLMAALRRPFEDWPEVRAAFAPLEATTGAQRPWIPPSGVQPRRAAVLVPIILSHGSPELLYTVRPARMRRHAGQVSFPGGRLDATDESPLAGALREAREEIGLLASQVEVIGLLDEVYVRPSNFLIAPYVGLVDPDCVLTLDPLEVELILRVPLADLLAAGAIGIAEWMRDGQPWRVPHFAAGGYQIWGATAALTAQLLARLGWQGWKRISHVADDRSGVAEL